MVIKSKELLISNPLLKFLSLCMLSISLSTLFESYLYINRIHELSWYQKYLVIFMLITTFIFSIIFLFNRKSKINFLHSFIRLIDMWAVVEVLAIITLFFYVTRSYIVLFSFRHFPFDAIINDVIILWSIYITLLDIYYSKNNIKSRFITIKILESFISKSNKNTLNKKISFIFSVFLLIQFIFTYISMLLFWFRPLDALIKTAHLVLPCLVCYAYIYKKLEEKVDYVEYIERNIKDIERGNLEHELDVTGNDELAYIANSINNISDGLNKSLEIQLKNERMKTELITNVSHDLKTPLTSIISYIDILKNNELDEQTTKTYLNILDKKASKLKTLVEDIFEASKISSGDIELNFEKTDIKELLIQSVVELDDKIESSNLDFIINAPDNPVFSNIDGKRMFRVFDNLITNITKYSLPNTRVYIDICVNYGYVFITMKNISNHKLNIPPDELLERFVRGDVSRNTNGSGLGLSIAKNLVQIQDGILELDIDGDLFKVVLKFKLLIDNVELEECINI